MRLKSGTPRHDAAAVRNANHFSDCSVRLSETNGRHSRKKQSERCKRLPGSLTSSSLSRFRYTKECWKLHTMIEMEMKTGFTRSVLMTATSLNNKWIA